MSSTRWTNVAEPSHIRGLLEEGSSRSAVSNLSVSDRDSSPEARGKRKGSHVVNTDS